MADHIVNERKVSMMDVLEKLKDPILREELQSIMGDMIKPSEPVATFHFSDDGWRHRGAHQTAVA